MNKIGLFYAPAKGNTAKIAEIIASKIGNDKIDLILIDENTSIDKLNNYDNLIFGISTVGKDNWDNDYVKVGWDFLFPKIEDMDFSNKSVAIFGLGNHVLYPNHFVDAMGQLGNKIIENSGNLIGYCNKSDYEFTDSEAIDGDKFIGLPIDQDTEEELTEKRINDWLENIKSKMGF
ncbi:MAG: flavodoxin [Bacteroidales bacterium]|nr:flavodoxin [Bacteroidales bacterium]MBN2756208.1 flavodoxin [Bacteroidales bacterium]